MMCIPFLCFLIASFAIGVSAAPYNAEVSHEDIRDAILSLVTIFRDNSDKLERHEYRERQLGEQLKKALAGLDKRYRAQDTFINHMSDQIKALESKVLQNQEREQQHLTKITDTVTNIQNTLTSVIKEVEQGSKGNQAAYTIPESPIEASISARLDQIAASIQADETTKKAIKETEKIVRTIESKIENLDGRTDSNTKNGNVAKELEQQSHILGNLLDLAAQTSKAVTNLPNKRDMETEILNVGMEMFNTSLESFQEIREELIASGDRVAALVVMKMEEKLSSIATGQEEIIKTTTEIQSMAEGFNSGVSQSYEQLLTEVRGLSKVEQVMIQTADNVMDTKRRVEYGVHQILLEVAELVKHQGKAMNSTVNKRFDDIEETILDNQSGALANLTTKIETEISQVWRQIGIMYQQLTASATALDRLQQQTDAYVNGSIKTMDSMESKVGMITSRMTEVDENLNFLLGRLSMVTSEYNQIKSGLAKALDDIKDSFVEAEEKIKDLGPGPRPIKEDQSEG